MTDQELKKLRKSDLLELLLAQSKEMERLKRELREANKKLADRAIQIEQAGSIAEAALQLSGIFEAAQKAADDYLYNITGGAAEMELQPKENEVSSTPKEQR